jgi:O-antigen/teichoic acid export membrane protein
MAGFGLGMALLAVATLLAIPTMIKVSGADAWAAIATGQAVGSVGAVLIAYGWIMSGPAAVATADAVGRRTEYWESLRARLLICLPVIGGCVVVAMLVVQAGQGLAALGSVSTAAIGLTASWYFVGTGQPYRLLLLETMPRVLGTTFGILLMDVLGTATAGLLSQLAGMIVGVLACSVAILQFRQPKDRPALQPRPIRTVLIAQRHGVSSSVVSTTYGAVPIVIVGFVNGAALPGYAVLDKIQKQIAAAISPFVQVFQGWVPRAKPADVKSRARVALFCALIAGTCLAVFLTVIGRPLIAWIGGGQIEVQTLSIALMSVLVALTMIESVLAKAGLVPLGQIALVAKITLYGSICGLVLTAFAAWKWGVNGALSGLIIGLLLRLSLELLVMIRTRIPVEADPEQPSTESLTGPIVG